MADAMAFLIAGLGLGAIYGLLGLGIVTLYRATGVLNFAYAATGMLAVFCYSSLTSSGVAPRLAALVVIVAAAPVGALIDIVAMRRYRAMDTTTKATATIALLVGFIGIANLLWSNTIRDVPSVLPSWSATVAGVRVPADRLTIFLVAIVVLVLLRMLFTRTREGVALRAMAADPDAAALIGVPVRRLSTLAWAVTTMLAALSLILIAPGQALNPGGLSLLVIPALAAAVIGGLRHPGLTLAGGLLLGVVEAEAGLGTWTSNHSLAVPFIVLLVVLLWRQRNTIVPALGAEGQRV